MQQTIDKALDDMVRDTELARRDKDLSLSSSPITITVPDGAASLTAIKLAVTALSESMPNQQYVRTQRAFRQLEAGTAALRLYLMAKGVAL
jgi:hypothetical protein